MKILLDQPFSFHQRGQRGNQEDARYPNSDLPSADSWAFAVCDGVGGSSMGEVASSTVCRAFERFMEDQDPDQPFSMADFQEGLSYAYEELYRAMERTKCTDMATTLTFLCLSPAGVLAAHMGDSRIYQLRPGVGVVYKSASHSLVEELVRSQQITPQEAIDYPQSNYITRCMCYAKPGEPITPAEVYRSTDVQGGDIFFLCSDGVLEMVPEQELIDILLMDHIYPQEKLDEIAARSRVSSDNNTAILVPVRAVERSAAEESMSQPVFVRSANACDTAAMEVVDRRQYTLENVQPDAPKSKFKRMISDIFG